MFKLMLHKMNVLDESNSWLPAPLLTSVDYAACLEMLAVALFKYLSIECYVLQVEVLIYNEYVAMCFDWLCIRYDLCS